METMKTYNSLIEDMSKFSHANILKSNVHSIVSMQCVTFKIWWHKIMAIIMKLNMLNYI